jgi:predicted nucleic acid-binding Zn ribbon protein
MTGERPESNAVGPDESVRLADALAVVVQSLGRRPGDASSGAGTVNVFRCWDDVVGTPVCEHARPVALDAGRLVVEVDQPGWATQLRFLAATLVARLAEAVGPDVVRSIEVRVSRR